MPRQRTYCFCVRKMDKMRVREGVKISEPDPSSLF